jgi:polar amino acid transport system substrate-binding protein
VEDNGCGITDSDRLMIFEPFYTTKNQGFGLGLYIVQKVAETHGGSVKVESSKDRGTIFIMTIPLGGVEFGGKKESKNSHCGR